MKIFYRNPLFQTVEYLGVWGITIMGRKAEYDFYKSIGICVRCHKRVAEPNKVMCLECAGRELDRYHKEGRSETTLQKDGRRKKIHYEQCKKDGICPRCGKKVESTGFVHCKMCRAKMREWRRQKRQDFDRSERTSYGFCYICGKNPVLPRKGVCVECYKVRTVAINKCLESREDGFNEYWKQENKLIFGGKTV